ncbi:hypothetical protein PC116_g32425 [Phytophthora cactorum]|nr:hypothetical protein PC116_g32425 [Phytophthora cactorum]
MTHNIVSATTFLFYGNFEVIICHSKVGSHLFESFVRDYGI